MYGALCRTSSTSVDPDLLRWLEQQGQSQVHFHRTLPILPYLSSSQLPLSEHSDSGRPVSQTLGIKGQRGIDQPLPSSDNAKKERPLSLPPTSSTSTTVDSTIEVPVTGPPIKLEVHEALIPSPVSSHTLARDRPGSDASSFLSTDYIKSERDESPVHIPDLRPCRQGTYRIPSLPPNCRKSTSGYKENRRNWVAAERRKLISKGLTIQKVVLRYCNLP